MKIHNLDRYIYVVAYYHIYVVECRKMYSNFWEPQKFLQIRDGGSQRVVRNGSDLFKRL